jgi:RimJ/RimL family protein N-acetyltransferase
MKNIEIAYLANNQQFLKEIAGYWCREWSESWDEEAINKKIEKLKKKANTHELPILFVSKDGDELVGTAGLFKQDLDGREDLSPWLGGVYIKEKYRNKGIASEMITRVLQLAKKMGFTRLYLYTESASGLYEKLGWTFMEDTKSPRGVPSKIFYLDL